MSDASILELCPKCQQVKEEEERPKKIEAVKNDPLRGRRLALEKAEKCRYFYHHGLYDKDGKSDSLAGQRTCSLAIKAKCGHEMLKHSLCFDWFDGKDCTDWTPKEVSEK